MFFKNRRFLRFLLLAFFVASNAKAITLNSGQTNYTTTSNITTTDSNTSGSGIYSTLLGTSNSYNKITNAHIITTGNSGIASSAYGIRTAQNYNQITNNLGASIFTTGSSGRAISVSSFSTANNLGNINTQGTSSYGIYGDSNNNLINSGVITTTNSTSYGIYANSDNNIVANFGNINAAKSAAIYLSGNANLGSNSGNITTNSGSSAYGVYINAGTASKASSDSFNSFSNSGFISSADDGIYNVENYSQITNSGSILSNFGSAIYGIRSEGNNVTITNSGNISATNYAINNLGENIVINNSGVINGGIKLGSGTLNILGGSISGEVDGLSDEKSTVIVGSDSNLGVNFSQTAAFVNLNSLKITGGATLNSSAEIGAKNIEIDQDSTLVFKSGSSLSSAIKGSSDSSGTLEISGTSFLSNSSIGVFGNSLANLKINSNASLTAFNHIYASNILVEGEFNFNGKDNLEIFGNLAGSGLAIMEIGANSQKISGNFSLFEGDILSVALKNGGIGNLTIGGAAKIDANSKLKIDTTTPHSYIVSGTQYSLISASKPSEISAINDNQIFINGVKTNNLGLLKFTTLSVDNSLILQVERLDAAQATTSKNAQNIYQNLESIGNNSSGKMLEFQTYLDVSLQVTQDLKQLAPQSTKASLQTSSGIARASIDLLEKRLEKNRHNSVDNLPNGFWGQAFGASMAQNQVKDDEAYKANSKGFAFGIDKEISDETLIGASLTYGLSEIKSADSTKKNVLNAHQINFFHSQNFTKYFFENFAAIALNQYSSNRAIELVNSNATSRYFGQIYAFKIKTGFVENLSRGFSLIPEISSSFLHNKIGGYHEKGADSLNLNVKSVSANFLDARIGLNLSWNAKKLRNFPEFKKFNSTAKISYGYSIINDKPTTTANFSGQSSSFNSQISQIDRGSLRLGIGALAYHEEDTALSFDYDFEKRATYQSHFANFKICQKF